MRARSWGIVALLTAGCASAPPPAPPAPVLTVEQHMGTILWLEDQRVLRDPSPAAPPAKEAGAGAKPKPQEGAEPPVAPADLPTLLQHSEGRIRWRAALAIGRVGLPEGVAPLTAALKDPEPAVRAIAAFGLGLIGAPDGVMPLTGALADPDPRVQGRAAEGLGLIGEAARSSADAIGRMVSAHLAAGALAQLPADDALEIPPEANAVRLGLCALVRLDAYESLAALVLDGQGQPTLRWWPVAYALQRIDDARALPALLTLARDENAYTAAFAVRGLGELEEAGALDVLLPLVQGKSAAAGVQIAAVRAVAQIGDPKAVDALVPLLAPPPSNAAPSAARPAATTQNQLQLEVIEALATLKADAGYEAILDFVQHPWPTMRAAALRALAAIRPDEFFLILSGLDRDSDWVVRAALATALSSLPADVAAPRLREMLKDEDARVIPAVLRALAAIEAPDLEQLVLTHLGHQDMGVRIAAARLAREHEMEKAVPALAAAYRAAKADAGYGARAASLESLTALDTTTAREYLADALGDKDWAVRVRAAELLQELDPNADVSRIRPAPVTRQRAEYEAPELVQPKISPQVYIETNRGTIQVQLDPVNAPLTVANFIALARKGFFQNARIHRVVPNFVVQDGDPRGDGEGGPGYTIRDELSTRPFLRGTLGMALDPWADTGGSQWFVTHMPQPHLDGRYAVFGRVVDGMEIVDSLQQWDVIKRVRVWDGESMTGG
jgi:cyclophilin family peptidyl-prolyl cis-trans isomerase/HEAT repeat protein